MKIAQDSWTLLPSSNLHISIIWLFCQHGNINGIVLDNAKLSGIFLARCSCHCRPVFLFENERSPIYMMFNVVKPSIYPENPK
jgi:hypothetical protein